MKGSDIYYSIVGRCLELKIDTGRYSNLFNSAILCMGANPVATDHDIFRVYFEREAVSLGIVLECRRPAPTLSVEECNVPDAFLEPLSFYLPKDAEIIIAHIEAYKNLAAIVPELGDMYDQKTGSRELTTITTYLMGDILEEVRQLHDKRNKP
jgi:hypothetical protein